MDGTLVVKENRNVINKFRDWYKEKIIETNKAQQFEDKFVKTVDFISKTQEIKSKIATTIIAFIPETKELASLVPKLVEIQKKITELGKNLVINSKRTFEAVFIGADGTNKDVIISDMFSVNEQFDIEKPLGELREFIARQDEKKNSEGTGKSR